MSPYFSLFLRAFGFKPGFRRTGPSRLVNIFVAAGVGVISGYYIFSKPLEDYWAEQQQQQQQAAEGKVAATATAAERIAASTTTAAKENTKLDPSARK